jgi:hypothetical protein
MKNSDNKNSMNLVPLGILLFSVLLSGCSQTEGGGSGGVGPSNTPYLIEGLLCSNVTADQKPMAIADYFPIGERIYIWLHWANISGSHAVEVVWYDPDGDQVQQELFEISTKNSRFITWFFLDTTSNAEPGEWLVSVFLDQHFIRSYVFELF